MVHAGKYARHNVLIAFEMLGGVQALAEWAADNPSEYYTKLFTKLIDREPVQSSPESLEELLEKLDRQLITVSSKQETLSAPDDQSDTFQASTSSDGEDVYAQFTGDCYAEFTADD